MSEVRLVALKTLPEVAAGADVAALISAAADREGQKIPEGCAVVVAQKIVSKAEGRVVSLQGVTPSAVAQRFANEFGKDPCLIEVILQQSRRIVKMERGIVIVETQHGFVCANGGVDSSNVPGDDCVTLLPEDPDASARRIRDGLRADCAVVISDTFGRPWREGLVNVAIGVAGLDPLDDYRGRTDRHGKQLRATVVAIADELAAAAGLLMGKADGTPVVFAYGLQLRGGGSARELVRKPESDLFR